MYHPNTKFYSVTKTFTAGVLTGLTITERTTVKFTVGKVYRECIGSGAYRIDRCEPAA